METRKITNPQILMTDEVKNILLKHLDAFVEEVGIVADMGVFPVGEATSAYMADAVELVWNAMGYSAKLQAEL